MAATKRTRTPSGLTPQLRAEFDTLLLTWVWMPLKYTRYQDRPRPAHLPTTMPEWEEQFGVGYYAERKTLLDDTLTFLDRRGKTDFPAVLAAVDSAKSEEVLALFQSRGLDQAREWETERRLVYEQLSEWLQRGRAYCYATMIAGHKPWTKKTHAGLLKRIEDLLKALHPAALNAFTVPWLPPGSTGRRSRRGQSGKPWNALLAKRLTRAGVPDEHQKPFFVAAGLVRYSDR